MSYSDSRSMRAEEYAGGIIVVGSFLVGLLVGLGLRRAANIVLKQG